MIIPITNTLKRTISLDDEDHGVMNMKRGVLSGRYKDTKLQPLSVLATVLDPRFKLELFSATSSTANARMMLIKECEEYLVKSSSAGPHDQPHPKHRKENKSSTLWSLFDEMLAESEENSVGHSCESLAEIIVEMYF